jgi:hypothetical protein
MYFINKKNKKKIKLTDIILLLNSILPLKNILSWQNFIKEILFYFYK